MGSLSNLYISQSYISLLHLGSNNTASSTFTEIEDGLGNGIGISVNTEGDLFVSNQLEVDRTSIFSGSVKINTAYTSSTPSYVNSGNYYTDYIIRITGSFASGSSTSPTVNEVQIGWPVYGNGLVSGAVVTDKQYVNSQFVELTINQNTAQWFGNYYFTNPTTFYDNVSVSGSQDITGSLWIRDTLSVTNISASGNISASNIWVKDKIHAYELDVTIVSSSIVFTSGSNILGDNANEDVQLLIGRTIITSSLEVTGSSRFYGTTTLTGSNVISGSTTNIGTSIMSGSILITGSTNINGITNISGTTILTGSNIISGDTKITGSFLVTGSMQYSGSVRGVVVPLSITSQTASMDCSLGNFFTLTLPTSSTVLINPINILPGETLSLRIQQPSAGTGSVVRLGSSIKFPSLNTPYSASSATSSVDILTFISFDSSSLFGSAVKNFI